jgi:quercetin dioxygenase-like cupin family protein
MNKLIDMLRTTLKLFLMIGFVVIVSVSYGKSSDIVVKKMKMQLSAGEKVFVEELLAGEIAETKIEHIAYAGPTVQELELSDSNVDMFVVIKGNGELMVDTMVFDLVPESIAIPMKSRKVSFDVPDGEVLHFVHFSKKLSEQDFEELEAFQTENYYDVFFTKFSDCEAYTEKIKSPNTVSRTVLPGDIIPRVALGTVEAPGPDEVGAHKHAMLDQLFLGLTDNDIMVHADGDSIEFKEYDLLHIPIGSSHWVRAGENKTIYYLWMDFFLTKEGQIWLKTHKPISTNKKDY